MRSGTGHLIGLTAAAILLGGWIWFHKFYVSLTEVRYNTESSCLEISMRIFPDDLDKALLERTGTETHLATSLEPVVADSLLEAYLHSHFSVVADGTAVNVTYLGKEPEADAIWCYFESGPIPAPHTLVIRNSLLTEKFEDQVNIVQVYAGDWNRGLLLTRKQKEGTWRIGE